MPEKLIFVLLNVHSFHSSWYCWIIYDYLRYLDSVRSKLRSDETLASFLSLFVSKKYTVLKRDFIRLGCLS